MHMPVHVQCTFFFIQADRLNPGKWKENLLYVAKVRYLLSFQYKMSNFHIEVSIENYVLI